MTKSLDFIQALEKAVKEKYGDVATMNPKHFWDENKEKEYIEGVKESTLKEYKSLDSKEKIELDGILVTKSIVNNIKNNKTCQCCKKYSFQSRDDLYLNKFNMCYKCYVIKEEK